VPFKLAGETDNVFWEVHVRVPRFRIAWAMFAVAIAALDFLAIRTFMDSPSPIDELLLLGALPMMNVLAISILISRHRPKTRPFFAGFAAFATLAMAVYIGLINVGSHGELLDPYLNPFFKVVARNLGRNQPFVFIPIVCVGGVIMLGLPQLVFAAVGGLLSRKFKITVRITPR
jgi:hypothetical protein